MTDNTYFDEKYKVYRIGDKPSFAKRFAEDFIKDHKELLARMATPIRERKPE